MALNEDGMEQAGMGVGIGDFNLDGNLDIFKTHFTDDTCGLYRNDGKGNFDDVTLRARASASRRASSAGARASSISTTTAFPISSSSPAACIPKWKRKLPEYPYKTPRVLVPQPGQRHSSKNLIDEAGPGDRRAARQPRLRFRRFR